MKMADYIQKVLCPYLQRSLYEIPPESVGHHSILGDACVSFCVTSKRK